jgi:hypothetical protein
VGTAQVRLCPPYMTAIDWAVGQITLCFATSRQAGLSSLRAKNIHVSCYRKS